MLKVLVSAAVVSERDERVGQHRPLGRRPRHQLRSAATTQPDRQLGQQHGRAVDTLRVN